MKNYLLSVALLLGATAATAQTMPTAKPQPAYELPSVLRAQLARKGAFLPSASRSTTVRKPGRATEYVATSPANQWSAAGTVSAYTYDGGGRITQIVESDSATSLLKLRRHYIYDAAGLQTGFLAEKWTGSAWQNDSRTLITNNAAGYLTEYLDQIWENGSWKNNFRISIDYDARNHYVLYLSQRWRNNSWESENGGRATVTYTAAGAVSEEAEELLDYQTKLFYPSSYARYTYTTPTAQQYSVRTEQTWRNGVYTNWLRTSNVVRDAQGRTTYAEDEYWTNNAWQLSKRTTNLYQTNGSYQILTEARLNDTWVNESRYTQLFDTTGLEMSSLSESWVGNTWSIANGARSILRYNVNNDLVSQVRQGYDPYLKMYVNSTKTTYGDYQSITLSGQATAVLTAATELYPNPTTGRTTLALAGLGEQAPVQADVVNSLGQVVQRLTLPVRQGRVQQTLELSQQPAGVYSVQLHTSSGLVVKKVVRN